MVFVTVLKNLKLKIFSVLGPPPFLSKYAAAQSWAENDQKWKKYSGRPIFNTTNPCFIIVLQSDVVWFQLNNACASGSTGVFLCKQIIESGNADVVLATGFEKMAPGSLENMGHWDDRANPVEKHLEVMADTYGLHPSPITCQMFANAGKEHMEKYGNNQKFQKNSIFQVLNASILQKLLTKTIYIRWIIRKSGD